MMLNGYVPNNSGIVRCKDCPIGNEYVDCIQADGKTSCEYSNGVVFVGGCVVVDCRHEDVRTVPNWTADKGPHRLMLV